MATDPWKLAKLLEAAGISAPDPLPDVEISQVTDDSRAVRPGALFVAVPGAAADGHRYAAKAVEQGAAAVMVEQEVPVSAPAVTIRVPSTREALGPLARAFWGAPSERLKVIGVTGTKGKTTVSWAAQHLLETAGLRCGLIGTVCHRLADGERHSDNTTPGTLFLQENLARMEQGGFKACAMEVSSHALDQRRVEGIRWACGVFTNFAPEHLDYHATLEQYLEAKLRLFQSLSEDSLAVINRDDPVFEKVRRATRARVMTYGLRKGADLTAEEIRGTLDGTQFTLKTPEGSFPARTTLIGLHNVENLLAAVGAVMAAGLTGSQAAEGLASFGGVPGRLERVECGQPFPVFVDYAHTDGALRRVLEQLRALDSRKILTVFGCGGDRDRMKRPRMGRAAAELSDRVIITSDNPRSEDPAAIAGEVLAGARKGSASTEVVLDRREAIRAALESADKGWLVLIAGKGHEAAQIFAERSVPFDDRAVAREILASRHCEPRRGEAISSLNRDRHGPFGPRERSPRLASRGSR